MNTIKLYYMRDNHTFRSLHGCIDEMMDQVMDEFDNGDCWGMLCAKSIKGLGVVHADGQGRRETFWEAARAWLEEAHKKMAPPFAESDGGECD